MTPPATLAIVQLTDEVARYMSSRLLQLSNPNIIVTIPPNWTQQMVEDCDHAVGIIYSARHNRRASSLVARGRTPDTL